MIKVMNKEELKLYYKDKLKELPECELRAIDIGDVPDTKEKIDLKIQLLRTMIEAGDKALKESSYTIEKSNSFSGKI